MRRLPGICVILAMLVASLAVCPGALSAGELGWGKLAGLLQKTPVDLIRPPDSCDQCTGEFCIQRVPVTECVRGKKLVYDTKMRYEYVTIPETRYRFVTRCVTKEVKCPYCMPTCETNEVGRCYESERWDTEDFGCGKLHCKSCEKKVEKYPCKHCGRKPGETVVKVRVRECVKEPYVVYRQVKRPVCIKQPRYEHTEVSVTRYVCKDCSGHGCDQCGGESCGQCDGAGCDGCGQ